MFLNASYCLEKTEDILNRQGAVVLGLALAILQNYSILKEANIKTMPWLPALLRGSQFH